MRCLPTVPCSLEVCEMDLSLEQEADLRSRINNSDENIANINMPWMNYTQSNKVNPMGVCVWDRRAVFWMVWVWRVWV